MEIAMESDEIEAHILELRSLLELMKTSLPKEIPFDFSYASDPSRAVVFRESCFYRASDIVEAAYDSFVKDNLIAAFILARAFMETESLFWAFIEKLEEALQTRSIDKIQKFLSECLVGVKSDELKKWKSPKDPSRIVNPKNIYNYIEKMSRKSPFYQTHYDSLSEHSHPNAAGTVDAYVRLDHEKRIAYFGRNKVKLIPELALPHMVASLKAFVDAYDYSASLLEKFVPLCEELLQSPT